MLAIWRALRVRRVSDDCTTCSIELADLVRRDGSVQMPALEPERSRPPSGLARRGAGAVGFLKTTSSGAGAFVSMLQSGERTRGEYDCMGGAKGGRGEARELGEERHRTYTERRNEASTA